LVRCALSILRLGTCSLAVSYKSLGTTSSQHGHNITPCRLRLSSMTLLRAITLLDHTSLGQHPWFSRTFNKRDSTSKRTYCRLEQTSELNLKIASCTLTDLFSCNSRSYCICGMIDVVPLLQQSDSSWVTINCSTTRP
jgi:hypothetical protein